MVTEQQNNIATTNPGTITTNHNTNSHDEDEDICAICLIRLSEQPSVQLSCSHRWHLECLRQQLMHSRPSHARRLVFNGIRCAICSRVCQHPLIDNLVAPAASLLRRVDDLCLEQASIDNLYQHPSISDPTSPYFQNVIELARATYAFYLCSSCSEPFFGGTIACADASDVDLPPEDRLCTACSPRSSRIMAKCTNPSHRPYYVWKCRFCCTPATYVCYANTHLCDTCHARDDGARNGTTLRLPPARCKGVNQCTTPFYEHQDFHINGPTPDCEQLLYCAYCVSTPQGNTAQTDTNTWYTPNMVFNHSGQHGTLGWTSPGSRYSFSSSSRSGSPSSSSSSSSSSLISTLHHYAIPYSSTSSNDRHSQYERETPSYEWTTETSELPFTPTVANSFTSSTNFVSSYHWACMAQCVDLQNFIHLSQQSNTTIPSNIEVSTRYLARTDCPSKVRFRAVLYDVSLNEIFSTTSSLLDAPADYWEEWKHNFVLSTSDTEGVRYVVIGIMGTDDRFWAGRYGGKVTHCCVRVGFNNEIRQEDVYVQGAFDVENTSGISSIGPLDVVQKFFGVHNVSIDMCTSWQGHINHNNEEIDEEVEEVIEEDSDSDNNDNDEVVVSTVHETTERQSSSSQETSQTGSGLTGLLESLLQRGRLPRSNQSRSRYRHYFL